LQKLVDNLKEDLKVVFNLFVIEEYKHREIAEMLQITENASKLRYKKAKTILQEQYNNLNRKSYE
jgi:RNA polymerase sigma-70 factor (ECF subfamily)